MGGNIFLGPKAEDNGNWSPFFKVSVNSLFDRLKIVNMCPIISVICDRNGFLLPHAANPRINYPTGKEKEKQSEKKNWKVLVSFKRDIS